MGLPDVEYTAYCTELASHGYVVFSINHTYDCVFVDFPDGRRLLQILWPENMTIVELESFHDAHIETWITDVRYVLDQVAYEGQKSSGQFYSRLDLEHIGVFGHSFGGETAVQCCRRDERCKAGSSLDSILEGNDFAKAFSKPFMFMRERVSWEEFINSVDKTLNTEEHAKTIKYQKMVLRNEARGE